jgi:hypothetical protein
LPWIPTTQPESCVFAGSLAPGPATLFAQTTGDQVVANVVGALVVERLELPAAHGGRYKLVVSYPVRGVMWLDGSATPLEWPNRADLVAGHLWVEPGTAATAWRAAPDRAELEAPVPSSAASYRDWPSRELLGLKGSQDLALEPDIVVTPASAKATASCRDLHLAGSASTTAPPQESAPWRLLAGDGDQRFPLFSDPGIPAPFAQVRGHSAVQVRKLAGPFAHVVGRGAGYTFDAWIHSGDVTDRTAVGLGLMSGIPSERTMSAKHPDVAVRLQPLADAPIVLRLSTDAAVYVVRHHGVFVEVAVGDLRPRDPPYFVEAGALEPYAASHPGAAQGDGAERFFIGEPLRTGVPIHRFR